MRNLEDKINDLDTLEERHNEDATEKLAHIQDTLLSFDIQLRQVQTLDLVKADFKLVFELRDKLEKVEKESTKLRSFTILNKKFEDNKSDYNKFKNEIELKLRNTIN